MVGATRVPGLARAARVGPRVFLRVPSGRDKAEYVRLREASEAWLRPWEPTPLGQTEPPTEEEVFERVLSSAESTHFRRLLICQRSDGAIVGQLSLGHIFRGAFLSCIAGYWIGAAYAGRGYMTEALGLGLDEVFGPMGLHRVEANINPENAASLRVVQRLGFRCEGLAQRYLRINGAWRDHEHWVMTREDYDAVRRPAAQGAGARKPVARTPVARTPATSKPGAPKAATRKGPGSRPGARKAR